MNQQEAIADIQKKIDREKQLRDGFNAMRAATTQNPAVRSQIESQLRDVQANIVYFEGRLRELQRGQAGPRPNFSKLDLIKYDCPYPQPRIQHMLSQIQFKLNVEKQYLSGIEKMLQLYDMDGDRKSQKDASARRTESKQKIVLLKQALKRYEELHIDFDEREDEDNDSVNLHSRKPLSGQLAVRVSAIKDVGHSTTHSAGKGCDTFVAIKVEDNVVARTRTTRTDRWEYEAHSIEVDKANEIEFIVYDVGPGENSVPKALMWVRISDIVEEMRRKKIEAEVSHKGWVSADRMGAPPAQFPMNPQQAYSQPSGSQAGYDGNDPLLHAPNVPSANMPLALAPVDAWFNLEPAGQIHLNLSFVKHNRDRAPINMDRLGRKGAVRRKEEVHEMYGHKFVQHQFYNIMRCALCGDFLKYSAGMQCDDCKYTCHTKCYDKVVTKCISKSNSETDHEEEKINHRIPHRFQPFSNMTANWCCHCGYLLPFGKKNCRKCSECSLTCHAQCQHLVPDFCGMSMVLANQILENIRKNREKRATTGDASSNISGSTLRPTSSATLGSTRPSMQHSPTGQSTHSSLYGPPTPAHDPSKPTSHLAAHGASNVSVLPHRPAHDRKESTISVDSSYREQHSGRASAAHGGYGSGHHSPPVSGSSHSYDPHGARQHPSQSQYGPQHQQHPAAYPQQSPQVQQPPSKPVYNPAAYAHQQFSGNSYPTPPAAAPAQPHAKPQSRVSYQQQPPHPPHPPHPPQQPQQPQQLQQSQQPQPSQPSHSQQHMVPPRVAEPLVSPSQSQPGSRKPLPSATDSGTGQRIGLDHFNFLAVLGKGNFGKVMLAEAKRSRRLFAIKVLKKEFIIENDEVESIRSEKRVFLIANRERHPFLTNLHACFQTETRVYFVMEYVSGGDLMLHIQRGQFGTRRAKFYAAEVCLALKYFHENGVIYRDLKLDNILLTLDGHIKIADYGLCKEDMWYGSTTSTFCGTPEFMAPEILLDKKYGRAVDWWAFGVLIYQMLLQQSPFRGEDEEEIYDAILGDEPLYPIQMPRDSVSILQKLLTREPDQRLGSGPTDAQEVMSQPFFRDINWEDIYHKRVPPPMVPQISSPTDTSNFDSEFTSVTPVLTPVSSVLSPNMQEQFRGFSYSADF